MCSTEYFALKHHFLLCIFFVQMLWWDTTAVQILAVSTRSWLTTWSWHLNELVVQAKTAILEILHLPARMLPLPTRMLPTKIRKGYRDMLSRGTVSWIGDSCTQACCCFTAYIFAPLPVLVYRSIRDLLWNTWQTNLVWFHSVNNVLREWPSLVHVTVMTFTRYAACACACFWRLHWVNRYKISMTEIPSSLQLLLNSWRTLHWTLETLYALLNSVLLKPVFILANVEMEEYPWGEVSL